MAAVWQRLPPEALGWLTPEAVAAAAGGSI